MNTILCWVMVIGAVLVLASPIIAKIYYDKRSDKIKTVKCLIDFGEKEDQDRFIELPNKETEEQLEMELSGHLPYICEFRTTKGEIISGSQIICKL